MADLAMLMQRATGAFAPDARFGAGDSRTMPEMPISAEPEFAVPPPDPAADAHAHGFAEGLAAARAEAAVEKQAAAVHGEALRFGFARLDAELAEALRQRLLVTVVALCEAALAPLALDRAALARRITRAVAMFSRADDERVIWLHPEDLAAAQAVLPAEWIFKPDPALVRGALRVATQSGGAEDGPEQWRQAITEALDLC